MIKRNILAVVIPALLIASVANAAEIYNKDGNKLDLYGKIDGRHYLSKDATQNGDSSYVQLGLKGDMSINPDVTGFTQLETQLDSSKMESSGVKTNIRLAFAGLRFKDYGSIDYGRNTGVLYDVGQWTDNILPEFGSDSYGFDDNYMVGRSSNLLTYRNKNFFGQVPGLDIAIQYQGKNEDSKNELNAKKAYTDFTPGTINGDGRGFNKSNGDGVGFSATYDLGYGLTAGAAYFNSDRTLAQRTQTSAHGDRAEGYTVGLKYDANNIYLAAIYGETHNTSPFGDADQTKGQYIANDAHNIELVAQYKSDFGLNPSLAYIQSRGTHLSADTDAFKGINSHSLVKYVDLATSYNFNKNLSTYVEYKINLLKNDDFTQKTGLSTDNVVGVGVVYQF